MMACYVCLRQCTKVYLKTGRGGGGGDVGMLEVKAFSVLY